MHNACAEAQLVEVSLRILKWVYFSQEERFETSSDLRRFLGQVLFVFAAKNWSAVGDAGLGLLVGP